MPQLWQGRSSKAVDSRVNDFNSSIRFDARMIEQDIHGSMVHSAMLGKQGIISQQDVDDIHKGLQSILNDLHSGALEIDPNAEDVHTFVEQTLTARVGDAGKRLHTGRSRNDQVALDIRLNLREASLHLQGQIKELILTIAAAQYSAVDSREYETVRLRRVFSGRQPMTALDAELLQSSVSAIHCHNDGSLNIQLKNGQVIGKE